MDTLTRRNGGEKESYKKQMKANSNKRIVLQWKDAEALSIAAAHLFVETCNRCIAAKGKFVVALSGGNTPNRLYQLLATPEFSKNIEWNKVFIFWGDERFVPHTDSDSNYRMVKENLLDYITIPPKNISPVPTEGKAKDCAKQYEQIIHSFFGKKKIVFDCVLLGIGNDGHTASLFPGTDILKEKKKLIKEVWVEEKQIWRISFTLSLINNSKQVIFLVAGKDKNEVVAKILGDRIEKPLLPSQLVKPAKGIVYWMLDDEAASLLEK